jgi:hypothetical protein
VATIINLPQGSITAGSTLPFYDPANGADRRVSVTEFAALLQTLLTASAPLAQYSAPAATGFSVTIAPAVAGQSVLLLLTPAAGYAAGTVVLPSSATAVDGQEVSCTCTQSVGTLTVSGNGATVNGAPASLSANGFFKLRFDGVFGAWYRVG